MADRGELGLMKLFNKILFILLVMPSLCFAGSHSVQITHGVVTGGGGGTLLAGDSSAEISNWAAHSNEGSHYDEFVAVASGNIAKGFASLRASYRTQNCKMIVYSSTGTIITTSAPSAVTTTGGSFEFTFSSGSITSSSTYYIGTVCDGSVDRSGSSVAWSSFHVAGTYASPSDISSPGVNSASRGDLRIWITD